MAIVVNKHLPEFEANATGGIKVTHHSHLGQTVILYFYPKDATPGCTAQACNLRDHYERLIAEGFDVEVDLRWKEHNFYLGHDDSQYYVPMSWLVKWKDKLWIHCKDLESIDGISSSGIDFHYFWHENDRYTLTSKGIGWCLVGQIPFQNSIVVLPESMNYYDSYKGNYDIILNTRGICSDSPIFYRSFL
jgi:hypothetical protein